MRYLYLIGLCLTVSMNAQMILNDFEGNATMPIWFGDDCSINTNYANPYPDALNGSSTVMEYSDSGGLYANVTADASVAFDLSVNNAFSVKLYVPSSGLTGSQPNQLSLKLQNSTLAQPWTTQTEIVKPIVLDAWQVITFDFEHDPYINLDSNSLPPLQRTDLDRLLLQVNGENNSDHVLVYIDDVLHFNAESNEPVFDTLVWADEFDGTGAVDAVNWYHQTQLIAGDSWANNEQQHYTDRVENAFVSDGTLKIVAKGETYSDQGVSKDYTSARLNSKFAFQYGRVEVRAKLPSIAGTWPAIWLLGKNIDENGGYWDNAGFDTTPWPWCGEIDIMEPNIPKTEILATWHWDNGNGYQYNSSGLAISNAETSQNWHIYALEWSETSMKIYLDDVLINQMPTFSPFDNEFYILLNVAMGGNLGGPIVPNFNQDIMEIDYVRVYQESALSVEELVPNDPVSFYPNPVRDRLHLSIPTNLGLLKDLQVTDVSGRIISKEVTLEAAHDFDYDVSQLQSGIYLMRLRFEDGRYRTIKFVKH